MQDPKDWGRPSSTLAAGGGSGWGGEATGAGGGWEGGAGGGGWGMRAIRSGGASWRGVWGFLVSHWGGRWSAATPVKRRPSISTVSFMNMWGQARRVTMP